MQVKLLAGLLQLLDMENNIKKKHKRVKTQISDVKDKLWFESLKEAVVNHSKQQGNQFPFWKWCTMKKDQWKSYVSLRWKLMLLEVLEVPMRW